MLPLNKPWSFWVVEELQKKFQVEKWFKAVITGFQTQVLQIHIHIVFVC